MNNQEDDEILYFPICPECNEIVSIDYKNSFNITLVCGVCKNNTLMSIENIKYKKINEINNNLNDILNTIKDNKKLVLNKVISIKTKLNYIFLSIIKTMYSRYYNKKIFSLNSNKHNNQLEKLNSLKNPSVLSYDDNLELISLLRQIYYFHFLYKSIIKIYEKTGINIFINQGCGLEFKPLLDEEDIILKFKIPLLLNSICNSSYYNGIKDEISNYLNSQKIYKYLENKEYFDNVICFSIFILPVLKYIVIAYKKPKLKSNFDFYDYQMEKKFNFKCDFYQDNILIRDLTDGKILISEFSKFSIYLKKKENNELEFIQEIDFDNTRYVNIPVDGITHNYFIIEDKFEGITIFEKKANFLNQKEELYIKKKNIKSNNKNIKGLFLNDNLLITSYKENNSITFEEKDIRGNCKGIKKYSFNLIKYNNYYKIIKVNLIYLLICDNYYIYFFNYELKQIETILELEPKSKCIFSRINQNLIFVKDNKININKLNIKTLELEKIKEINIPNVFKNCPKDINCVYSANKLIYNISCKTYNKLYEDYRNIAKLFIID